MNGLLLSHSQVMHCGSPCLRHVLSHEKVVLRAVAACFDCLCVCVMQPEAELGDSDSEAGSDANKVSKRKKKLESRLQIAELKQVHLLLCCAVPY